jgi:hypothetical protein
MRIVIVVLILLGACAYGVPLTVETFGQEALTDAGVGHE